MPATVENLDHLLVTDVGLLDIVQRLCGTYEELVPGSTRLEVGGHVVFVPDPKTVLDRLDGRERPKDLIRRQQVDQVRAVVETGAATLVGLNHLV